MSRYWSFWILLTVIFSVLTFVVGPMTLFWNKPIWLPADYSEHGGTIDGLFYFILILTGVVFLVTELALFYFMWKYDAKANTAPVVYSHGSHTLEIVWTIILRLHCCSLQFINSILGPKPRCVIRCMVQIISLGLQMINCPPLK